ncbi:MAG TPA: S53 family peptidase [Streptosporangiaceae bacterium]
MNLTRRLGLAGTVTALAVAAAVAGTSSAQASPSAVGSARVSLPGGSGARLDSPAVFGAQTITPPFIVKVIGRLPNGQPKLSSSSPTGLSPSAIASVYNLSGLSPTSGAGAGQIIAIVDAYHDPNALSDLNTFNTQYGYPQMSACTSLSQAGSCFMHADPQGRPGVHSVWVVEESLDIEWAHAEAPAAKIVLVEAKSGRPANLFGAVSYANSIGATEVSMSWGGGEFSSETLLDSLMTHAGTFYTASAGDSGHGAQYPAASPNVIAVGGTTLNGCSGISCSGFTSETAWSGSGGGISAYEPIPAYQDSYKGPVSGASTISELTSGHRGIPDVSFDASPRTGVSVYDSTGFRGQRGWFTLGGTSVGAPNWAGILAAGAAAGKTLQGNPAIYSKGYLSNLRDITSGTNGTCGTDCTAGNGYDLVTGLGSPISYP